jgi:aldose 1-epimerase
MFPSGEQYEFAANDYRAVVTQVGATLRDLQHAGRDLIAGFAAEELRPASRGALLIPWPNRIADGRYTFDGKTHQVPINEVSRNNAMHGLVSWQPWHLVEQADDSVVLAYRLFPMKGYPFALDISATYALGPDGLTCRVHTTNIGDSAAPYGCAAHPYLVAGPGLVDEWTLQLPAASVLQVSEDRKLPIRLKPLDGTIFDFRTPRKIGDAKLDHAYTDLTRQAGTTTVRITAGDGSGVQCKFGPECEWVQVFTSDLGDPSQDRASLAVEPMTCPADAFNSGVGLIRLEPGASHTATWTIAAIRPDEA